MMNANTTEKTGAEPRLKSYHSAPAIMPAMLALQAVVNKCSLERPLMELVKTRASQINRCAFCLNMHLRDALAAGERPERLYLLDAWEEVDLYSPRERAGLAWTEALTRLADAPVSDELFAEVRAQFSEPELLELTLAIVTINGWNRFNVGFRVPPNLT